MNPASSAAGYAGCLRAAAEETAAGKNNIKNNYFKE